MFVYSLAGKIASNAPIVRSYTRRKQEQEQLNRQHVLQQAVELELSKQHIASAVTLLSDAFLDASRAKHASASSSSHTRRPSSPESDTSSSGTATPTAEHDPSSSSSSSGPRKLRSVRSNPLLRLLPSNTPASSASPTPPSQRSRSPAPELIPTQNYAFAPTLPASHASSAPASLANSTLADQYIQSVHFLLSALSPTQAAQLPEVSRRQMRMSLSQAIDRLDLAAATLHTEQERSSFWSARSQVSALDRLLRGVGDARVPSPAPPALAPQYSYHHHYAQRPLSPAYAPAQYPQLDQSAQSRNSTRERAVEIATLPAHLAYGMASQACSAMLICTQLALSVAIPIIWMMLRMTPVNVLRPAKKGKQAHIQAQGNDEAGAAGSLLGLQTTARNAATQMVDFANSPLGMYANAMIAKHAPSVHAGASAVWSFAEEQLSNNAAAANSGSRQWQAHIESCPAAGSSERSVHFPTPSTDRTVSSSTSSQQTLVGSPWPRMNSETQLATPQDQDASTDGKFLTWPRQPVSPRLRTISAPDYGSGQGHVQAGVPFPTAQPAGAASISADADALPSNSAANASDAAASAEPPINKRRWSSLIGRTYTSSNPSARPPLPEGMSMQRQHSAHTHPSRALSVSTAYPARPSHVEQKQKYKHTRQHSWAPEHSFSNHGASSSTALVAANKSVVAVDQAGREVVPASHHGSVQTQAPPSFPEVLNSLSVQTSRVLSDPQSSYSLYNLVPGASLRRSIRKSASRSMRQAIFWARTNGVLRAGVDAVCVGLEAALAGVEAWGDAEYERQEEGRPEHELSPEQLALMGMEARVCPCPCGQVHYTRVEDKSAPPHAGPAPRGLGISLA
ncbi:hypothetical protein OC844_000313 [Tilletia horrida]|nr:hypothetical protein OC844_000313 [Tilletia horrida]